MLLSYNLPVMGEVGAFRRFQVVTNISHIHLWLAVYLRAVVSRLGYLKFFYF